MADQVGACTTALALLHGLIEAHVLAAERLYGDDTTVPILAKGKTITGHIWTYVRDDRPFGGTAPPAALYYASRDRRQEHLDGFAGILQADAYAGYNGLYDPARSQGTITSALCWAHARRKFFVLADIAANARRGKGLVATITVHRGRSCATSASSLLACRSPCVCRRDRGQKGSLAIIRSRTTRG